MKRHKYAVVIQKLQKLSRRVPSYSSHRHYNNRMRVRNLQKAAHCSFAAHISFLAEKIWE